MVRKKTPIKMLLAAVLCFGLNANSYATHAVGADLTYRCLGGNQYEINLSFYRDCAGIAEPASANIRIQSASCGTTLTLNLAKVAGSGQEVSPICASLQTTCGGGTYPGVREWIYRNTVTLPAQCSDWVISYDLCCRNNAITTIQNPGGQDMYVYATLDNKNVTCNSSPVFSNKPVPFACLNQKYCFNHGAIDADGDSVVYSLVTPSTNPGVYVSYLTGYSGTSPVASNPPVSFDNATGSICMTPTQQQVTVLAVLVREFRNGVQIGSVIRDIQLKIINCNNMLPQAGGINGTNNYNLTVCPGAFCFDVSSIDPDGGQIVTMSWNDAIPGATFNTTSGSRPVGTFCWTPTAAEVSTIPYCFTVDVTDDACPYNGGQIFAYCITVKNVAVDAGADKIIACGSSVQLAATSISGTAPYTYLWSSGQTTPSVTTAVSGTYTVTITDASGCSSTDEVIVTSTGMMAGAGPDQVVNCSSTATISVTVSGGSGVYTYQWNTGQNSASITAGAGTYIVTVLDGGGCMVTDTIAVIASGYPVGGFTAGNGCEGTVLQFNDNSSIPSGTITAWNWNFGDGTNSTSGNPSHTYAGPGTYTITLIVTSDQGCRDTVTGSVTVYPKPIAGFAGSSVCQGGTTFFTDQSSGGTTWTWTFGDGTTSSLQNPSHQYTVSGTYSVTLTVSSGNGCTRSLTKTVSVYPLPVADFSGSEVCLNSMTLFTDLSGGSGTTYSWNFGDGTTSGTSNPSHLYNSDGTYTVTMILTSANGCIDSITKNISVYPLPSPYFTAPDACFGNNISFTDGSSGNGAPINSWSWNFGNGTTSTIQNPSCAYSAPGNYLVTLTVSTDKGCSVVNSKTVRVFPVPAADFTVQNICENTPAGFVDLSGTNGSTISTWSWSFGDGSSTLQKSPAHNYAVPGSYPVTLKIVSSDGCSDSITKTILVSPLPAADFTAPGVCSNSNMNFTDNSSITSGTISSWYWNFGNGMNSSLVNPVNRFSAAGTYPVTLIITSTAGCRDTIQKNVSVFESPAVTFNPVEVCLNNNMNFDGLNTGTAPVTSWNWNFGDGSVAAGMNSSHLYLTSGTWDVTLTSLSPNGCSTQVTKTVTVNPLPVSFFSFSEVCIGQPTQFKDSSSIITENIRGWNWNFGDTSGTSSKRNPVYTYGSYGIYNVTLVVTTDKGCKDTLTRTLSVNALPVVDFTDSAKGCSPLNVFFRDLTTVPNGVPDQWLWDFGDLTTGSEKNPVHLYTTAGTYDISLTVTSNYGCKATKSMNAYVEVYPKPQADFEANPSVMNELEPVVKFTDLSAGAVTWDWDFGDKKGSMYQHPVHVYKDAGKYAVQLIISNAFGCLDTIIKPIEIKPGVSYFIPNAFTPNDGGPNDSFKGYGIGVVEVEMYIFDRWGTNIIYYEKGPDPSWNGKANKGAEVAQEDVYVYIIYTRDILGKRSRHVGHVTLMK